MKRILIAMLALAMLVSGIALADESILVVGGSGKVYLDANQASISLGVSLKGKDLTSLQQQVNERVNAICSALTAAGLPEEEISTGRIYISPVYNYENQSSLFASSSDEAESAIDGYTIDHALYIQTENIEGLGAYIDAAFAAGANSFDSISFGVQDDSEAAKKALEIAVQDARNKAEIIAAASGKALGDVLEIREGSAGGYNYSNSSVALYDMKEAAAYGAGTTVRASQVEVNASVEITYELK